MVNSPGIFIVFEGGEGSGKSTQIKLTSSWLHQIFARPDFGMTDWSLRLTKEPGGTPLGESIRELLLWGDAPCPPAELLLYAADRAQHVETLRHSLKQKCIILSDRFTASSIAYQGYGRGLPLPTIQDLIGIATDGLKPDLTLWLDVPPELGLERAANRGERDRLESAALKFHQDVWHGFNDLWKCRSAFTRIDGRDSPEMVQRAVQVEIAKLLADRERKIR